MNLNPLSPAASKNSDVQRLKQTADATSGKKNSQVDGEEGFGDRVTISQEARRLQRSDQALRHALDNIPDERREKLVAVREKLKEGHYLSENAADKIADSIITRDKFNPGIETTGFNDITEEADSIDEIAVSAARVRKAANFYHREETIRETAEKLLAHNIGRFKPMIE